MTEIKFNGDSHGEDLKIALMRGKSSVKEHMEYIADRWVSSVRKNDIVFDLGDLGIRKQDNILALYKKLPGKKHLIWGNHDPGFPGHRKAYNNHGPYREVFESMSFMQVLKSQNRQFVLSHMPYTGEHTLADGSQAPDRYPQLRLPNLGLPNIHAHVHQEWLVKDNMINVGVDVWPDFLPNVDDIINTLEGTNL